MPIRLDTRHYVTHHSTPQPVHHPRVTCDEDELAAFLRTRSRSLGIRSGDPEQLVAQWQHQPKQASFLTITQTLLAELALPCGESLELVLFCHWSTDCEFGHSISNYIVDQCKAQSAFAFAISDSGPVAPFVAYALIRQWSLTTGRALVVTVDQSSHLHHSVLLSDHLTDNVGAAMVWSCAEGNGLFSGYYSVASNAGFSHGEWVATLQAVCPFDLSKARIVTDTSSQAYWPAGHLATVFDDGAPSAWPFHLAKPWLAELSDTSVSLSGLVLCRTYRDTTHLLWFYSENSHENN
ncbi:hypothetical protein Xvie_03626 [Xenorhabdus vietnamensis]|uniref:Beta-ketoacyl-[acyl-carrier-protein] synthase III N-terminal domain-containing protein n=1 Tax=Xenorhabdus vietnamensis TaxID=351656 RepID=A0A1Y2SAK2_9GAMM|nr:hypothetical protein Xvie_03626 [Xenorhabdus vietnamensis]